MIKTISKCLAIGLSLAFAFSLVGCGSSSGGGGAVADGETVTRVANTYDEGCALCHGDGRVADVTVVHDPASNSPVVSILAVRQVNVGASDDRLEVDFKIVDSTNPFIPIFIDQTDPNDYRNVRFALAKLVPPAPLSGDSSYWQSYINRDRTVVQATYERANAAGGAFSALATPGEYRYRLSFNMNTVTDPVSGLPITYDVANTHRIAIQFVDNVDNATVEFEPNALPLAAPFPAVTASRRIAVVANCNECHVKLGFHGGDRVNLDYCVTCHNPGTTDVSGWTADFKVMIHKIHRGAELPSVLAGGQYALGSHDWGGAPGTGEGGVEFPQDIRNCTKCHRGAAESDNWKLVPTREACGSCHDDVNFDTGLNHNGGQRLDNTQCSDCHLPSGSVQAVTETHVIPEQVAAAKFKYNIISVTNTAPGEFPVITLSVQDPTDPAFVPADPRTATYDINNDPEFQPAGGARSLTILVGWFTTDYTNTGSTATPGQPIRISALAGAVDNLDGSFTVASTVPIPDDATGSGVVAIEGHPAAESVPGSGTYDLRVPVTGAVQAVAITDAAPQSRRVVVDAANCNNCHGLLSLHGANRNNNTQLCVLCHNANATDINRRPADPTTTTDGKAEEAIDFKYMIHSIHAGAAAEHGIRTEGIVVYGFGGTEHDFSHVRLPGEELNLLNCQGCHNSGTNELPDDLKTWPPLPTTIKTGADAADPDDDVNITPTASVCSSCHDGIAPKTHMADNGGVFDFRAFTTTTSGGGGGASQASLCGPGPASAQPAGHSTRTDCCSCHSPN